MVFRRRYSFCRLLRLCSKHGFTHDLIRGLLSSPPLEKLERGLISILAGTGDCFVEGTWVVDEFRADQINDTFNAWNTWESRPLGLREWRTYKEHNLLLTSSQPCRESL